MKILKALDDKFELFVCIILMTLMTCIIFVQVFMRYVMQNSLVWSEELARYIFIWLIYMGISYGAKIMKHIKIDAALGLFPRKVQPIIVIVGDLLFLGFALFITHSSYTIVQRQIGLGQSSPAMQIPMWIIYAAPMVGFAFTSIRQVQTIIYRINILRSGGENNG
ncbi:TRAP transporter small permease subunit [Alkalibaculum sp. M08DMB]|uniref:TRAP transporter small permease subunit n=1 Tax=Alkalibaculum sporogenes TaxID=2655001 RepID=A0A6A7K7T7_9FIRM|nr:TRAP transporter small permease [Alkalibaculum sporogenes]MPW25411.1 TRAP transporter small permease subunit [Alkalibaculum sporogenes]